MKHEHMIQFRLAQVCVLCKFALAYVLSLCYKRREIWLISERGVDARDNGYWFFQYLRTHHSEVDAYYLITKSSVDYERLKPYVDHVIEFCSMHHYIMLWRSSILASAHVQGYFPFRGLGLWIKKVCPAYRRKRHICLKHGITCNYSPFLEYSNTQLDLIISAAQKEYDYFVSKYHYPKNKISLTGLCRYDNLNTYKNKKQILLMPTWREWLYKEEDIVDSEYVKEYVSLLNNSSLHQLLEENEYTLVFYPHHEMQRYLYCFENNQTSRIVIANKQNYDVQQLLKESEVLITDYSSVFFDVAYMRKPILFYQFDKERFRKEHYDEGWYSYDHGLGPVLQTETTLLTELQRVIQTGCIMEEKYATYSDSLFAYRDSNNCERVYNAIIKTKREQTKI